MHICPERPGFHPSPPNRRPQTCRAQLWSKKKCLKLQFSWLLQMNPLYVPLSPFPSFLEFNFQKYIMPLCNLLQTLGRKHSQFGPLSRCPFPASILVHPDFVSLWASPPAEAQVNTACLTARTALLRLPKAVLWAAFSCGAFLSAKNTHLNWASRVPLNVGRLPNIISENHVNLYDATCCMSLSRVV